MQKRSLFLSSQFSFYSYIAAISPEDGRNCWPKHVVYVRKKCVVRAFKVLCWSDTYRRR